MLKFIQFLENENPKRRDNFNGHGIVTFAKGNEQGKFKQGLKLGKCFLLPDDDIREIRGNFENNVLQVYKLLSIDNHITLNFFGCYPTENIYE